MNPSGTEHPYFPGNEYHSPPTGSRIKGRWFRRQYFRAGFIKILFRNRHLALKGVYDSRAWAASSLDVFRLIERSGGKFHLSGLEHLSRLQPPVVFVSNHMSTLETMIFPGIIAPLMETTFVVKESLVKHPLFGPIMRSRNPVVVGRSDPRADLKTVLQEGSKHLQAGRSVILFPQSTRKSRFSEEEFNSLGVKLAKTAGVSMVPIAIRTDFWSNGKFIKDLGPIYPERPIMMDFGEEILLRSGGKEEHRKVLDFIRSRLDIWYSSEDIIQ